MTTAPRSNMVQPRKSYELKKVRDIRSPAPLLRFVRAYVVVRGRERLTVALVLLRKVPPPAEHAAIHKYGWRESRQWHRNDTACSQL